MLVQCDQKLLLQALKACQRLARLDLFLSGCTLVAQAPSLWPATTGKLFVRVWSDRAEAGVLAEIPALVARAGTLSLPFQPLTDLVASLPGEVQLWQGQVTTHNALAPMKEGSLPGFLADTVLVVEHGKTTHSHRSRLRALMLAQQGWGGLPEPVLSLGQVSVKAWRQALAPCLLLTREHAAASSKAPEMDHTQVLIRFEPARLTLLAATPYEVVQTGLRVQPAAQEPLPFIHAGFSGDVLEKVSQMVPEDAGPLTLQVVSDPPRVDLHVRTPTGLTLVCRGTLNGLSLVWERPFREHPQRETRVERRALIQACLSLAAAKHHPGWDGQVRLQATRGMCVLSLIIGEEEVSRREVPLLTEMPDVGPVQIDLTRLRRLVKQLSDSEMVLQWGKHGRDNPLPLDCLRLGSPGDSQRLFIMMVSNIPDPSPSKTPQEVASV